MTDPELQRIGLPPIDQVGLVVRDIEAATRLYDPLFGPFTRMDSPVPGATYRGREADCDLKIAYGYSGDLEIELIECTSGESPHREFVEAGNEGLHHVRFRVDDTDGWLPRLKTIGYEPIWYKRWSEDTVFAYLERKGDSVIVELLQMPE